MNPHEGAFVQDVTCQPDPCFSQERSILRFAVLALLFLTMFGTALLLILLEDRPYGIQLSSIVGYTAAVALYTFSGNRNNMQPFLLSCPVVRRQLAPLIRRHLGFLAALFIVQTTALKLRPNLPAYLITPRGTNASRFAVILGVLCGSLAIVQVLSNRSLLERAHVSRQAKAA
jgi:hypothetical protein